ncbi:hypothetical protein BDK51DRAFT_48390 [Blyttiomyces helicus]|uniref:EXS domain-containing protein n=1 Tax=Blyttiomyces helicus TaxID=388810 RepID=A0A4P9VZE9_9FUNG|nr:hypothetical protein BDK51DRAFT_48390 [Blyttiomyces helicus]|eukprot:RKO84163.1 hypothetical protein BDK51DRAFT_48390 [Blyttiomyces helicus]
MSVIFLSAGAKITGSTALSNIWIVVSIIASMYSYSWDVLFGHRLSRMVLLLRDGDELFPSALLGVPFISKQLGAIQRQPGSGLRVGPLRDPQVTLLARSDFSATMLPRARLICFLLISQAVPMESYSNSVDDTDAWPIQGKRAYEQHRQIQSCHRYEMCLSSLQLPAVTPLPPPRLALTLPSASFLVAEVPLPFRVSMLPPTQQPVTRRTH